MTLEMVFTGEALIVIFTVWFRTQILGHSSAIFVSVDEEVSPKVLRVLEPRVARPVSTDIRSIFVRTQMASKTCVSEGLE